MAKNKRQMANLTGLAIFHWNKERLIAGAILALFLAISGPLQGQVVNTESKRLDGKRSGWDGSVDAGLSLIKNTKEILQFTNRVNVQYAKNKHTLLMLNDLRIMRVNKDALLNRGFQHFRYNYEIKPFIIPEAFVQAQYDQIWKIDLRFLAGAGPRFRFLKTDTSHVYMGTLMMYEYEQITDGAEINRDVRFSIYLSAGYAFNKVFKISNITYFQPRLDNPNDFRISTETQAAFSITSRLGFKARFSLSYDTRPPAQLQNTFYSLVNSLSFNF